MCPATIPGKLLLISAIVLGLPVLEFSDHLIIGTFIIRITIKILCMKKKLLLFLYMTMSLFIVNAQIAAEIPATERSGQGRINSSALNDLPHVSDSWTPLMYLEKLITGTITDDRKNSLTGVSVTVKGTSIGTTSDVNGKFSLTVPDGNLSDSLVFTSIGYEDKVVAIDGQDVINVVLDPVMTNLNQVVVVGYGTQKRAAVTAAIASVPMKEIKDMPVSNVATALQGKVAGVVVQQNNGAPGSTPAIKVRGLGSISAGNSPLIVVDGNIVSPNVFSLLNSSEIQSIDVLKDASSTAIYGSRGSNGVIIVTTRKGKSGRTNINLDVYGGFQEVTKKLDLLNSREMAELSKEAANNAYLDNVPGAKISDPNSVRSVLRYRYPRGEVYPWLNFDDPQKIAELPDYDLQDLIFRRAPISNYQLSVSGGTEKAQFYVGGGYLKQEGVIKESEFERYTIRAGVDVNVSRKLKVGLNINPSYRVQQEVNANGHWADNGIINAALAAVPMAPLYAADGSYSSETAIAAPYNWPGITNPVANITEFKSELQTTNLLGNAYLEYQIIDKLTYRASGNVNLNSNRRNAYRTSAIVLNQLLPPNLPIAHAFSDQGLTWLFNHTLNYTHTFNDDHDIEALIGMESYKSNYQSSRADGSTFANDIVQTLNDAGLPTAVTSFKTQNATSSYFARVGYSYRNKYLVNASIRRDGSSVFGPDNRWGTFPAGSIGWRITEEPFMKNFDFLSEAKIRVSYGLSGNNAFSNDYPYVASVSSDNYSFNNNLVTGLAPSSLGNAKLGWEKSNQLDVGIDIGLLNDRIFLVADYYVRNTKDLLLSVNVPTLTGFSTAFKNIGEMENKGWEFALNTRNITGAFTWNTGINLSFNRNKVLALGPTGDAIKSGSGVGETNITLIGEPIGSFYGYKQIGIFKDDADLNGYPHSPTSRAGDVKYEDVNGDKVINADDRTVIGNNQPDFIYGMSNTFNFKNFDLNIAIQGVKGAKILNLGRRFFENVEGSQNQLSHVLNRWRSPSDPGDGLVPRSNGSTTGMNNAVSSRWVEDGSYLRINNITFGYQVPKQVLQRVWLQQARIYFSVQNVYTWTDYLNYNPEVSNYEASTPVTNNAGNTVAGSSLTGGVDYGAYPLARTFTLGINLGF
jgi:TonB-linked SusC/RagA family outer membrane protein